MLWASNNGNEKILRALIKHNALAPYQSKNGGNNDDTAKKNDEEEYDPFVKPKDPRKVGRYTPLHWASYRGH